MTGYPVPAGRHRVELEIKRSRFIATLARAGEAEAALAFIAGIREEFPDASHHCYAYQAGPPGDTARIGMSDAGEPRGSAGRPMLTVLLHAGVGEIAAVVSRYFGGTKLGTGGLARAYGGAVQSALESLPTAPYEPSVQLQLVVDYPLLAPLERWLHQHRGAVLASEFGARVELTVSLPVEAEAPFRAALGELGGHRPELSVLERQDPLP